MAVHDLSTGDPLRQHKFISYLIKLQYSQRSESKVVHKEDGNKPSQLVRATSCYSLAN